MKRRLELIIFWSIFFGFFLSLMISESIRIENRGRIRVLERKVQIHKQWAEEFSYRLREHTHYYNGKPKPF